MANLTTDTMDKANRTSADIQKRAQSAEKSLETITRDAGERVGALASDFASSASSYVKASSDYVRENPLKGVAFAAAAGVIAGSIFTMAARRRP